jgi:hypothetical protein
MGEISKMASRAISFGSRIKVCVRVLLDNSVLSNLVADRMLRFSALEQMRVSFLKSAISLDETSKKEALKSFRAVEILQGKLSKRIRRLVFRYLKTVKQDSIAMENLEYHFLPLNRVETFDQTKKMLLGNKFPIMSFLCSAPSLCSEKQEIFSLVTLLPVFSL